VVHSDVVQTVRDIVSLCMAMRVESFILTKQLYRSTAVSY